MTRCKMHLPHFPSLNYPTSFVPMELSSNEETEWWPIDRAKCFNLAGHLNDSSQLDRMKLPTVTRTWTESGLLIIELTY